MPSRRASTACRRAARAIRRRIAAWRDARAGQGTLEYALVLFAFLAMVAGAGSIWHLLESALPVQHALQSASHHVSAAAPGAFSDVFMY